MKFYTAPHTCAVGIHLLLEEVGAQYQVETLDFRRGEQHQSTYTRINPKAKVPAVLRDDGSVLTEFGVIALWIARTHPEHGLLPTDLETELRALEVLDYVVGTMHGQGFARIFKPANFAPTSSDHDQVRAAGQDIARKGFGIVSEAVGGRDYVAGRFSIADAALFYVENWAGQLGLDLPDNLAAHRARMYERPAVRRVLAQGGYNA